MNIEILIIVNTIIVRDHQYKTHARLSPRTEFFWAVYISLRSLRINIIHYTYTYSNLAQLGILWRCLVSSLYESMPLNEPKIKYIKNQSYLQRAIFTSFFTWFSFLCITSSFLKYVAPDTEDMYMCCVLLMLSPCSSWLELCLIGLSIWLWWVWGRRLRKLGGPVQEKMHRTD